MKKVISLLLMSALVLSLGGMAYADTLQGGTGWSVTFTADKTMVSNFKTSNMDDVISQLQPGDSAVFNVTLSNSNSSTTDWYMTNEVLKSLEQTFDTGLASGGAYTYILTYDGPGGHIELFNSDTVGGEGSNQAGEGLHQATDAMEDYFFLDTLTHGQSGHITLTVGLDGETQGNDYQDTLANLQMNFAVMLNESTPTNNNNSTPPRNIIKTGDESNMLLYMGLMGISGLLMLLLAIYGWHSNRKSRKEGQK